MLHTKLYIPSRNVSDWPATMLDTVPLNWAPGGELSVTSMVSPMNWSDILDCGFVQTRTAATCIGVDTFTEG